jgi:hypothetical protein
MDRFRDGAELLAALERAVAEPDAIGAPPKAGRPEPAARTLGTPEPEPAAKRSLLPWMVAGLAVAAIAAAVATKLAMR